MENFRLRKRVAENVVAFRRYLGLSQKDLAKKSLLSLTYIGYIENQRRAISIDALEKIALSLKTEPCILLSRNLVKFPGTGINSQKLLPTILKEGEAAFAFWTTEGMEFHPLAKNTLRTSITMLALLQANGFTGKELFDKAKMLHIPFNNKSSNNNNLC